MRATVNFKSKIVRCAEGSRKGGPYHSDNAISI
jgi:hypothetical protein